MVNRVNANPRAPGIGTIDTRTGFETLGAAALDSTVSLAQPLIRQHAERQDKAGAIAGTLAIGRDENGHLIPVKLPTGNDVWSQAFRRSYIRGYTRETSNDARRVFNQLLDQINYDSEAPLDEFQEKMTVWTETTMANMDPDMEAAMQPMFSEMASQYFTTAQGRKLDFDRKQMLSKFNEGMIDTINDWVIGYNRNMRSAAEIPDTIDALRDEISDHVAIGSIDPGRAEEILRSATGIMYGQVAIKAVDDVYDQEGYAGAFKFAKDFLQTDSTGTGLTLEQRRKAFGLMLAHTSQRLRIEQYEKAEAEKAAAARRSSYFANLAIDLSEGRPIDSDAIRQKIRRDSNLLPALKFADASDRRIASEDRAVASFVKWKDLIKLKENGQAPTTDDLMGIAIGVLEERLDRSLLPQYVSAWEGYGKKALAERKKAAQFTAQLERLNNQGGFDPGTKGVEMADMIVEHAREANPDAFSMYTKEGQDQIVSGMLARGGLPTEVRQVMQSAITGQNPQMLRAAATLWRSAEDHQMITMDGLKHDTIAGYTLRRAMSERDALVLDRIADANSFGGHSDEELMKVRDVALKEINSGSVSVRPASQAAMVRAIGGRNLRQDNDAFLSKATRSHHGFWLNEWYSVGRVLSWLPWIEDFMPNSWTSEMPESMKVEFDQRVRANIGRFGDGVDLNSIRKTSVAQMLEAGWGLTRFGYNGNRGTWDPHPFERIKRGNEGDFDYVDEHLRNEAIRRLKPKERELGINIEEEIISGTATVYLQSVDRRTLRAVGSRPDDVAYNMIVRRTLANGGVDDIVAAGDMVLAVTADPAFLNYQDSAEFKRSQEASKHVHENVWDLGPWINAAMVWMSETMIEIGRAGWENEKSKLMKDKLSVGESWLGEWLGFEHLERKPHRQAATGGS